MRTVDLHAIEARLRAPIRRVAKTLHHAPDLVTGQRTRLCKLVAGPGDGEMHVRGRDRVRVQRLVALAARVRELGDEEGAVGFGGGAELAVARQPAVVVVGEDGVAVAFDGGVGDHEVAADDDADAAAAPGGVEADELVARDAAGGLEGVGWFNKVRMVDGRWMGGGTHDVFAVFVPVA